MTGVCPTGSIDKHIGNPPATRALAVGSEVTQHLSIRGPLQEMELYADSVHRETRCAKRSVSVTCAACNCGQEGIRKASGYPDTVTTLASTTAAASDHHDQLIGADQGQWWVARRRRHRSGNGDRTPAYIGLLAGEGVIEPPVTCWS